MEKHDNVVSLNSENGTEVAKLATNFVIPRVPDLTKKDKIISDCSDQRFAKARDGKGQSCCNQ